MGEAKRISSFSVLLLMAVAAVVGVACFSQLNVQYSSSASIKSISVSYSYPGASPRVVEAEVTSVLEGALANIESCEAINSDSYDGGGRVELTVNKKADMGKVRFEVASVIRNVRSSLPASCSYPEISRNTRGRVSPPAIVFQVRSPWPTKDIASFVEDYLVHSIANVKGVGDVVFYGQTPFEFVITFDSDLCNVLGITAEDISSALHDNFYERMVGLTVSSGNIYGVKLRNISSDDLGDIPIAKVGDRIVYLSDVATYSYQQAQPTSFFRVNGLNVLSLAVGVLPDENIVNVVSDVKKKIEFLGEYFPDEVTMSVSYDNSEYVRNELEKIYFRTALCLLILLLFVFVVNRSWRYMAVIALTLAVNLLVSVAVYFFCGLSIHIYTLAGITVSLGIIIDNSIMMIDHYSRYRNRSVFPALFSAVLTTVGALLVVFLLPEAEKANLGDFSFVIAINLCVSLLVAYLFVPALLEYFPVFPSKVRKIKRIRRKVRRTQRYGRIINWGLSHRWVYVLLFVFIFGLPLCLLKDEYGDDNVAPLTSWQRALNKIVQWPPYSQKKMEIDRLLGGTFALFHESLSNSDFYREPSRDVLQIMAGMPEGCSVSQLNDVVRCMENYLSQFDEIESFQTNIYSARRGNISVQFKPEFEDTFLPLKLKADIMTMAANFGGANWVVSGFDESFFNNNIITDNRSDGIVLKGYNYDRLIEFADALKAYLSKFRRVSDVEVWGADYYDRPSTEYNVDYDFYKLSALGISPYDYYGSLYSPLYDSQFMRIPYNGEDVAMRLESSTKDNFDAWHVENVAVDVDGKKMKLSEVGSIVKEKTGLSISRTNQSYTVCVKYNYLGNYQTAYRTRQEAIDYMNSSVLPVGFKAEEQNYRWMMDNQDKTSALILLVIAVIFAICAIHFSSIRYPLAIIWLIPISFIGVFLTFGLGHLNFDKGGFAAFVMLAGITVNAGIYLVSTYRSFSKSSTCGRDLAIRLYLKAFNRKLWPVSLTMLSTVLGLIPFLFDGPKEVFWFTFAIGTISGLVFSVVALLLYLPIFAIKK